MTAITVEARQLLVGDEIAGGGTITMLGEVENGRRLVFARTSGGEYRRLSLRVGDCVRVRHP